MERYVELPEFTGPDMLPKEKMDHYRDNIRPNMQYCGISFLSKLKPWCAHIKEYDLKMKSLRKNMNYSEIPSIVRSINDAECYDSYYCNVPSLSSTVHSLMVAMIIISVLAFIGNVFCFIKMHLKYNRNFVKNSFGIYLSAIIVFDCVKLVLMNLLYVIPALAGNRFKDQLLMYQRFTFLIVPVTLPLLDLSSSIVTWLVVALLVQRSNITRTKLIMEAEGFGFANVSSTKDRRKTYYFLALTIVSLFIFTVPKFAEYTFNYDITTEKGIVIPLLRIFKLYRIIYLKFLSPSVECMVPIIVMLTYFAVIKYNEVLLTRHRHMRLLKISNNKSDGDRLISCNSQVLSASGISRKTQLVIWISVVVLINLLMKLSDIFVELERRLEGSPREEWPRLRQITKYLSISISIIVVAAKPVIYIHCCPRFLKKSFSKHSNLHGDDVI